MRAQWIGMAALAVLASGCQTWGPTWSELSGDRYTAAVPDRRPAILIKVGDQSIGSVLPYRVAPGTYRLVVQSPVHNRFRGSEQDMTLTIEPCKRYYINAQFDNPTTPNWHPVVDYVQPIAGCRTPG